MIYNCDNLTFQIQNVGLITHEDGLFCVAGRPQAALSYRKSGCGRFKIDNKSFVIEEGDLIFVPAHKSYEVEYLASESIVVHLLNCSYDIPEKIVVGDRRTIEAKFFRMLDAWHNNHAANQIKASVYDVLYRLEQGTGTEQIDPEILRCVQTLEEHYADFDLTVEALCCENHVSRSSLQRKFKQAFGVTPKQYMMRLRMNRALDMLTENNDSIRSIAYSCGFEDEKYFSRMFKQTFGYPPREFNRHF